MISPYVLRHSSPAPHFKTSHVFMSYFPKCPSLSTIQSYAPDVAFYLKFKSIFLVKRGFMSLNTALAMAILGVISCVYLASFVIILSK